MTIRSRQGHRHPTRPAEEEEEEAGPGGVGVGGGRVQGRGSGSNRPLRPIQRRLNAPSAPPMPSSQAESMPLVPVSARTRTQGSSGRRPDSSKAPAPPPPVSCAKMSQSAPRTSRWPREESEVEEVELQEVPPAWEAPWSVGYQDLIGAVLQRRGLPDRGGSRVKDTLV